MPIVLNPGDGVNALASLDEFRDIDDLGRARILRASAAARELVTLRRRLGEAAPELLQLPAPAGDEFFPLDRCPPERRGAFALTVVTAWSRGILSRDATARALGVPPTEPIERVADHFNIVVPPELATG
jgi:hypothetical protein